MRAAATSVSRSVAASGKSCAKCFATGTSQQAAARITPVARSWAYCTLVGCGNVLPPSLYSSTLSCAALCRVEWWFGPSRFFGESPPPLGYGSVFLHYWFCDIYYSWRLLLLQIIYCKPSPIRGKSEYIFLWPYFELNGHSIGSNSHWLPSFEKAESVRRLNSPVANDGASHECVHSPHFGGDVAEVRDRCLGATPAPSAVPARASVDITGFEELGATGLAGAENAYKRAWFPSRSSVHLS